MTREAVTEIHPWETFGDYSSINVHTNAGVMLRLTDFRYEPLGETEDAGGTTGYGASDADPNEPTGSSPDELDSSHEADLEADCRQKEFLVAYLKLRHTYAGYDMKDFEAHIVVPEKIEVGHDISVLPLEPDKKLSSHAQRILFNKQSGDYRTVNGIQVMHGRKDEVRDWVGRSREDVTEFVGQHRAPILSALSGLTVLIGGVKYVRHRRH